MWVCRIVGDNEWPTAKLMPWTHTDKINVGWSVWRFDKTLADLEPEQGKFTVAAGCISLNF